MAEAAQEKAQVRTRCEIDTPLPALRRVELADDSRAVAIADGKLKNSDRWHHVRCYMRHVARGGCDCQSDRPLGVTRVG